MFAVLAVEKEGAAAAAGVSSVGAGGDEGVEVALDFAVGGVIAAMAGESDGMVNPPLGLAAGGLV
jgi:hypothetical protein